MIAKNGKPRKTKAKLVLKTEILGTYTLLPHGIKKFLKNFNYDLKYQNL